MYPSIKNIMLATGLGKYSTYALRFAFYLAKKHEAKLHILNVFEWSAAVDATIQMFMSHGSQKNLMETRKEDMAKLHKKRAREYVKKALHDEADAIGKMITIDVKIGDPVMEILQEADKLDCDLIVMGNNSRGPGLAFLGNTAEKVLRRTQRPVLIIPVSLGKAEMLEN